MPKRQRSPGGRRADLPPSVNHWNVAYGETFLEAAAARFDVERKTADDVTFGEFTSGRYVLRVCCLKPSGIGSPRRPVRRSELPARFQGCLVPSPSSAYLSATNRRDRWFQRCRLLASHRWRSRRGGAPPLTRAKAVLGGPDRSLLAIAAGQQAARIRPGLPADSSAAKTYAPAPVQPGRQAP